MTFHQSLSLHLYMHAMHCITYGEKLPSPLLGKSMIFLEFVVLCLSALPAFTLHSVFMHDTKMLD